MDPMLSGKKVLMNLGRVRRSLAAACMLPLLLAGCSEAEPTPQVPDPTASTSPVGGGDDTGAGRADVAAGGGGGRGEAAEAFVEALLRTTHVRAGDRRHAAMTGRHCGCETCQGAVDQFARPTQAAAPFAAANTKSYRSVSRAGTLARRRRSFVGTSMVKHSNRSLRGSGDGLDGIYPAGKIAFDLLQCFSRAASGRWPTGALL